MTEQARQEDLKKVDELTKEFHKLNQEYENLQQQLRPIKVARSDVMGELAFLQAKLDKESVAVWEKLREGDILTLWKTCLPPRHRELHLTGRQITNKGTIVGLLKDNGDVYSTYFKYVITNIRQNEPSYWFNL